MRVAIDLALRRTCDESPTCEWPLNERHTRYYTRARRRIDVNVRANGEQTIFLSPRRLYARVVLSAVVDEGDLLA